MLFYTLPTTVQPATETTQTTTMLLDTPPDTMLLDTPPSSIPTLPPSKPQTPGHYSLADPRNPLAKHWKESRSFDMNLALLFLQGLCGLVIGIVAILIAVLGSWAVIRLVYFYLIGPGGKVSAAAGTAVVTMTVTATEQAAGTITATVTEIWSKVAVVSGA